MESFRLRTSFSTIFIALLSTDRRSDSGGESVEELVLNSQTNKIFGLLKSLGHMSTMRYRYHGLILESRPIRSLKPGLPEEEDNKTKK